MIYGYMRVSTAGQVKGNSLEEQQKVLESNGASVIYQDTFTGTKTSRPNFSILINKLRDGDTLVVTKLDRFARNTVEGINMVTKHTKPSMANQQGGIVHQEGPLDISNVMYVHKGKPTRVGFKMDGDKKVRFAKSTGEVID